MHMVEDGEHDTYIHTKQKQHVYRHRSNLSIPQVLLFFTHQVLSYIMTHISRMAQFSRYSIVDYQLIAPRAKITMNLLCAPPHLYPPHLCCSHLFPSHICSLTSLPLNQVVWPVLHGGLLMASLLSPSKQ